MKTNKNKTADSKKKYGTMTASADANNDYTSSTGSNSATSSITSESMSAVSYTHLDVYKRQY